MRSAWDTLSEAADDDDDLASLVARAKGKDYKTQFPGGEHVPFSTGLPQDTRDRATRDAGLSKTMQSRMRAPWTGKNQPPTDTEIVSWLRATRYADLVIAIDDRKEMAELVSTLSASMGHKKPLSPQLVGRYVGKLLLAYDEDQARQILMDLIKELNGEKR